MSNQGSTHTLQIPAASVCPSVILSLHQTFVLLPGASLCVCPSCVPLPVSVCLYDSLSAGQRLNGGPCHISLGLSYLVPLRLSTRCRHQQLPPGNDDHFLDLFLNNPLFHFLLRTVMTSDGIGPENGAIALSRKTSGKHINNAS